MLSWAPEHVVGTWCWVPGKPVAQSKEEEQPIGSQHEQIWTLRGTNGANEGLEVGWSTRMWTLGACGQDEGNIQLCRQTYELRFASISSRTCGAPSPNWALYQLAQRKAGKQWPKAWTSAEKAKLDSVTFRGGGKSCASSVQSWRAKRAPESTHRSQSAHFVGFDDGTDSFDFAPGTSAFRTGHILGWPQCDC